MASFTGVGSSSGPLYVLLLTIDDAGSAPLHSTPRLMTASRYLDLRSLTVANDTVLNCNVFRSLLCVTQRARMVLPSRRCQKGSGILFISCRFVSLCNCLWL